MKLLNSQKYQRQKTSDDQSIKSHKNQWLVVEGEDDRGVRITDEKTNNNNNTNIILLLPTVNKDTDTECY